jgi:hypothetical protein
MARKKGTPNKHHVQKIQRECQWCGVTFEVYPSRVNRGPSRAIYCTMACQRKGSAEKRKRFGPEHALWKGGSGSYRERAIAAYGAVCANCGYAKESSLLWVHHKDFARSNHNISNLEVLCIRCHLERHLERDRSAIQV